MSRMILGMIGAAALAVFWNGQETTISARKGELLEQEYAIAKTSASYFIFDFEARVVYLKAKGFRLKEWPITKVRKWGRPIALKPYALDKKSAINKPQRKNITPKPGEAPKSDELDVLELEKMPVQYTLELADEIRIQVRPEGHGFKGFLKGVGRFISWSIFKPVKTVSRALGKNPFTDIEVVLATEKDAKGIYWSFFEGQKCLLYWSR
jgi:hypothetical protein